MKVIILGASDNPDRYAYKAAVRLDQHGHEVIPVGIKKTSVLGKEIITLREPIPGVDTITLYISRDHQPGWYDFILNSKPRRIIFNPGTENHELKSQAERAGIVVEEGCTLVMLNLGVF